MNECYKLENTVYVNGHDWVEKAIHWEICKWTNLAHTNKGYNEEPEPVLELRLTTFSVILR